MNKNLRAFWGICASILLIYGCNAVMDILGGQASIGSAFCGALYGLLIFGFIEFIQRAMKED